jgi:hypothetical protein
MGYHPTHFKRVGYPTWLKFGSSFNHFISIFFLFSQFPNLKRVQGKSTLRRKLDFSYNGGEWTAKQHSGDIEASSESTFEILLLVQAALAVDSTGGVQFSYSSISPSSAVFQVHR